MVDFDAERNPVEVLADEFSERLRRGECPSMTEYIEKHPDLAAEIQDLFPSIAMMEQLGQKEQSARDFAKLEAAPPSIERIGDYRILREVGRGGMGVVYEAEQESLGRRVAVKVLNSNALSSPRQLARFQREAQSAASLHHSNIVPVFGVGHQDGLHYYVMQLIDGAGLDVILAELRRSFSLSDHGDPRPSDSRHSSHSAVTAARMLREGRFAQLRESGGGTSRSGNMSRSGALADVSPNREPNDETIDAHSTTVDEPPVPPAEEAPAAHTLEDDQRLGPLGDRYWKSIARVGMQLAESLYYAHTQGVLHRDIKPSNLLLDRHGVVWITDFGLAKHNDSQDLTHTGDIVGTLKYMAPEQFQGQGDNKTDIYSLGLTLYELLTLSPAVSGESRGELVQQIMQSEPVRPRQMNPALPRDLETIVLKAIARDPAHRYATAAELADDLERFVEDRPIRARQTTIPERIVRWCRRNPAVACWAAVAATLLLMVAVVATVGYLQTKSALANESEQREKAEATLEISLDALDNLYERFAGTDRFAPSSSFTIPGEDGEEEDVDVPKQPVLSKEAAAILESILRVYDRFAEQDSSNMKLRSEAARANRRVGDIHLRLGQLDEAKNAYERAIAKYQGLAQDAAGGMTYEVEIARVHNGLASVYRESGKWDEARDENLTAMKTLEPRGDSEEAQYELARTYYYLGRRAMPLPGGPPHHGPGPGLRRPGGPGPPPGFGGPPGPDRPGHPNHGPRPEGRPREGPRPDGQHRDGQHREGPRRDGPRREGPPGGGPLGHEYLDKAIELLVKLRDEKPTAAHYQHLLAVCYRHRQPGFLSQDVEKATSILEQLCEDFPHAAEYRHDLAETLAMFDVRDFFVSVEELDDAEQRLRRARGMAEQLVVDHPNVPDYVSSLATIHHKHGALLRRMIRQEDPQLKGVLLDSAELSYSRSVRLLESLATRHPDVLSYQIELGMVRNAHASLLHRSGKLEEARRVVESSTSDLERLKEEHPELWFLERPIGEAYGLLSEVAAQLGDDETAEAAKNKAGKERHRIRGPGNGRGGGPPRGSPPDGRRGPPEPRL